MCILLMSSCSSPADEAQEQFEQKETVLTDYSENETTKVVTTEEITTKLSSMCDIILASGTSETGDYYELVAVEQEDYTGTKITVGVIKNNQWLIELTNDSPVLDENGLIGGVHSVTDLVKNKLSIIPQFKYIGNHCFYINIHQWNNYAFALVWNVENNVYYKLNGDNLIFKDGFVNNNEYFIIQDPYSKDGFLLDTNQMTVQKLNNPVQEMIDDDKSGHVSSVNYTPYSEGLYAITDYYTWGEHQNYEGFYDIDGNRVIDLSQYKFANNDFAFKNGVCEMVIINDQNSYYKITIDKTGNVINSEKIR